MKKSNYKLKKENTFLRVRILLGAEVYQSMLLRNMLENQGIDVTNLNAEVKRLMDRYKNTTHLDKCKED